MHDRMCASAGAQACPMQPSLPGLDIRCNSNSHNVMIRSVSGRVSGSFEMQVPGAALTDAFCIKVIRVRAWSAAMLGGGLRFTAAAPAADLLLKPLLRKPLLAEGVQPSRALGHVQPKRPKKEGKGSGNGQGSACQGLKHGFIGMNRFRHLSLLSSESEAAASPLVCLSSQFLTAEACRCIASKLFSFTVMSPLKRGCRPQAIDCRWMQDTSALLKFCFCHVNAATCGNLDGRHQHSSGLSPVGSRHELSGESYSIK